MSITKCCDCLRILSPMAPGLRRAPIRRFFSSFLAHERILAPSDRLPAKILDEGLDQKSLLRSHAEAVQFFEREGARSETIERKAQGLNVFVGVVATLTTTILSSKFTANDGVPGLGLIAIGFALVFAVASLLNALAVGTPSRFGVMQPSPGDAKDMVAASEDKYLLERTNDMLKSIENNSYINEAKAEFLSKALWLSCLAIICLVVASGSFLLRLFRPIPLLPQKDIPISVQCLVAGAAINSMVKVKPPPLSSKAGDGCVCSPAAKSH